VNNNFKKISRFGLSSSAVALSVMLTATAAFAQEAPAAGDAAASDDSVIIVTGSLIKNPNLVSAAPVTSVAAQEISLRQSNVAESLLREIPGVVANIGSAVNNGNNGASYVDLRGLGSNRNIVLLDGNRLVPSNTVGRVDLNNIPLALVQRVDVLTGGASTTYGADAVSGVVNFITRKDFAGVEVESSNQITERGDGNIFRTDVTVGANFDDGRGNAVLSIGYQQADPVYQGERSVSNTQYNSITGRSAGSDVTVPAEFVLNNALVQIDPASGSLVPVYSQFNFNPFNVFQTPFKRFNMFAQANYQVSDNIEVYTRGIFSKNTVNTIIAPSGIFDEVLNVPSANPYLPAAARTQFCNDINTPLFDSAGNSITHDAAGSARCLASASITNPAAAGYTVIGIETLRRTPDVGPRISEYTTTFFDYKAGLRGDITSNIQYDLYGSYGESENVQTIKNYVLLSRAVNAVNATNTTSCITGGTTCVPLNIFGGAGTITPGMASYLSANSTSTNKTSLAQAHATVSGDFGAVSPFATDAIGFAVGGEFRKYVASQSSDLLAQTAGELGGAGGAAPTFSGGYHVYEAFGELIVPLVQDKPFAHLLQAGGGIRYSSYTIDTVGKPSFNTTTWKGELKWAPVDAIQLRGNYQHAVRAPNINELFTPITTGLTNLSTEPCVGAAPLTNANLAAVCRAQGAPASSIGSIANPNSGQANATGGGNPLLKPEVSNSYTLGVVLQPREYVPGLTISVDYYNIKVKGAITTPTPGDVIAACFSNLTPASATSAACTSIRRNPGTGQLSGSPATTFGLPVPLSNLGKLATDGIDVSVNYSRDLGFTKLGLSFSGNYTASGKFQATPTSYNRDCVGYYSTNCLSLQPEYSWNQRTTLGFGFVDVSLLWRHLSSMKFEGAASDFAARGFTAANRVRFNGTLTGGTLAGTSANFNKIKAYDYFDLTAQFFASEHMTLTMTVANLFDKDPPLLGNTIGSTTYNSGNTYPSTYDPLGRSYRVTAKVKF